MAIPKIGEGRERMPMDVDIRIRKLVDNSVECMFLDKTEKVVIEFEMNMEAAIRFRALLDRALEKTPYTAPTVRRLEPNNAEDAAKIRRANFSLDGKPWPPPSNAE